MPTNERIDVSLIAIIANPERFDGKLVRAFETTPDASRVRSRTTSASWVDGGMGTVDLLGTITILLAGFASAGCAGTTISPSTGASLHLKGKKPHREDATWRYLRMRPTPTRGPLMLNVSLDGVACAIAHVRPSLESSSALVAPKLPTPKYCPP